MNNSLLLTRRPRLLALSCAAILSVCAAPSRADEAAPPAPVLTLQEGVRVPLSEPSALRPGDLAPAFALPDIQGNLISSRAWLTQRSLLVLSLSAPPAQDAQGLAAALPGAPLSPEQVLVARRISEAVKGAAPRLQKRGVVLVITAGGPYFAALKDAMGTGFVASTVPEVLEPDSPNLFLLRDDQDKDQDKDAAPAEARAAAQEALLDRRVSWSGLAGRSESGVALTGIDIAGFVRLNEEVSDLLNLEALLSLTGDVSPKLQVGQIAPDFSMRDAQGRARRLSDLRGQKNLLLTFFPKCFTGG